jgi:hypothetical protein
MIAKTMIGKTATLFFSLCITFLNTSVAQVVSFGESYRIHSSQVNEDREYKIYLPDSYKWARDKRYPVLYLSTATPIFCILLRRSRGERRMKTLFFGIVLASAVVGSET